jgi:hypothetical protein
MTLVMSLLVIMSLRSKPRVRVLVVDTVSGARDSGLGACSASPLTTLSRCRCAPKKCEKLNHKGHEGTRRTNSARPKPSRKRAGFGQVGFPRFARDKETTQHLCGHHLYTKLLLSMRIPLALQKCQQQHGQCDDEQSGGGAEYAFRVSRQNVKASVNKLNVHPVHQE